MTNTNYNELFTEMINFMDFDLDKDEEGFCLVDLQGANLANIESEHFHNAREIVERMSTYVQDIMLDDPETLGGNGCYDSVEEAFNKNPDHPLRPYFDLILNHLDEIDLNKCVEMTSPTEEEIDEIIWNSINNSNHEKEAKQDYYKSLLKHIHEATSFTQDTVVWFVENGWIDALSEDEAEIVLRYYAQHCKGGKAMKNIITDIKIEFEEGDISPFKLIVEDANGKETEIAAWNIEPLPSFVFAKTDEEFENSDYEYWYNQALEEAHSQGYRLEAEEE